MDQQSFLLQCREESEISNFAAELSDLLSLSLDAIYRRMRGTTPLNYLEIQKICNHYNVSFDATINYSGRNHPFQFTPMFDEGKFNLEGYFVQVRQQIEHFLKFDQLSMTIVAMDIPHFRLIGYPNLLRFKLFYWQRSILNKADYRLIKFNPNQGNSEIDKAAADIYLKYHQLDSEEIWSPETLNSTLKQITYGIEAGYFEKVEDAIMICDDLHQLLDKIEHEALVSKKHIKNNVESRKGDFNLYQSEILLGNNTIQVKANCKYYTYVGFNSFNSLMSHSPAFTEECQKWIEQIKSKSNLLNYGSEKQRYNFFHNLKEKVNNIKLEIRKELIETRI